MKNTKRVLAVVLCALMLLSVVPVSAFASIPNWETENKVFEGTSFGTNGYYNVISKKDYTLIPGAATESEMVINNSTGTRRQVMHIIEVDPSNPDVSIVPGYYGIDKIVEDPSDTSNWKAAGVTDVANYYDTTLGYQVVGAMNTALAYDCNAPYSWLVYNGEVLVDAKNGVNNFHDGTCSTMLCVYKDAETGECSVELRTKEQGLRGDEWQAIGANFAMTVNNGELVNKSENHNGGSDDAARSMVGVKPDGTLVLVMNDGRGSNNSKGFCTYELGESMLALGCQWAFNCDGGGSSSFVTRRAGEDDLVCRAVPCDGAERPTINSVLVVSNVAPTGVLDVANITSEYDYVAPGTAYTFGVTALDTHGYSMDLPADAVWTLSDTSFGTISNGTFTSNGKLGKVNVQIELGGSVIGSYPIEVANPTTLKFTADSTTLPYGKSTTLAFTSLIGEAKVYLDGNSFDFALSNNGGTLNGLTFTAGNDEKIEKTVVTATYKATSTDLTFTVNFGKGSETLYNFEDGIGGWLGTQETLDWLIEKGKLPAGSKIDPNLRNYYNSGTTSDNFSSSINVETFYATEGNGYVHSGDGALGVVFDYTQANFNNWEYGILFCVNGGTVLRDVANGKKATALGMWMRMPENFVQEGGTWANQLTVWKGADKDHLTGAQIHFMAYSASKKATVSINNLKEEDIPENRWIYVTATLPSDNYVQLTDAMSPTYRSPSYLRTYIKPNVCTKFVWYIDDITLDYSSAVDDRVAPTISNPQYSTSDTNIAFTNGVTISEVSAAYTATISDDNSGINASTAQIYIDGNKVATKVVANTMFCDNITLGTGRHLVKFEVADNLGNYTTLTREIVSTFQKVELKSGYAHDNRAKITISGHNDSGTAPMPGSVYYIDINFNGYDGIGDGATITLSLNTANSWILDGIVMNENADVEITASEDYLNEITLTFNNGFASTHGKSTTVATIPIRVYNPLLTNGTSDASAVTVSGKLFIAPLSVKCYTNNGSYGNYDDLVISDFAVKRTVTRHEHTATPVADLAPTCTVAGYTGRTYCSVCQSIVDFGTEVAATGHTWTFVEGVLKCECGELFNGEYKDGKTYVDGIPQADGWVGDYYYRDGVKLTGVQLVDGYYYDFGTDGKSVGKYSGMFQIEDVNYYAIVGTLVSGWQSVDTDWYYFDTTTMAAVDGEYTVPESGVTFTFNNGKVTAPTWVDTDGHRYCWYGPSYYKMPAGNVDHILVTIEGKDYIFDRNGWMQTGRVFFGVTGTQYHKLYDCDSNGVATLFKGPAVVKIQNTLFYFDADGLSAGNGVVKIGNDYYYVETNGIIKTNIVRYVSGARANGLVEAYKDYTIGADGKMQMPAPKNGVVNGYLYIDNVKVTTLGVVKYGNDFYYIENSYKVAVSIERYVSAARANGLIPAYKDYTIGADGKIQMPEPRNGVVNGYLYINDVKVTTPGVVKLGNDYYYIENSTRVATNIVRYVSGTRANGLIPAYKDYTIGADGKIQMPAPRNGVVNGYLYENDVKVTRPGVYKLGNDYYYIENSTRVATSIVRYVSGTRANGLVPAYKDYTIGSDGKMIVG